MNTWQPIETAPEETEVLIGKFDEAGEFRFIQSAHCFDHGNEMAGEPAGGWYWHEDNGSMEEPTHWMPLPEAPAKAPDTVVVPVEVLDLYNFMVVAFVPQTPQQVEINKSLHIALTAMKKAGL